jgi:TIR domain
MDLDVFISYAKEDKTTSDTICLNLENIGIQCWIAPRNIAPGEKYAPAIVHAIDTAKIVVVVFSHYSEQSAHVRTEIERAFNQGKTIIPFRIENIEPSDEIQYFIGSRQWLDAFSGSLEEHTNRLAGIIRKNLSPDQEYQGSIEHTISPKINQSRVTSVGKSRKEIHKNVFQKKGKDNDNKTGFIALGLFFISILLFYSGDPGLGVMGFFALVISLVLGLYFLGKSIDFGSH